MAEKAEAKTTEKSKLSRRNRRKIGRDKRRSKLATDKEYAKGYFEARSKRSDEKKVRYKKRRAKKA